MSYFDFVFTVIEYKIDRLKIQIFLNFFDLLSNVMVQCIRKCEQKYRLIKVQVPKK